MRVGLSTARSRWLTATTIAPLSSSSARTSKHPAPMSGVLSSKTEAPELPACSLQLVQADENAFKQCYVCLVFCVTNSARL